MVTATRVRHGRFQGTRSKNVLEAGQRFQCPQWPDVGVHNHGEPKSNRTYEDVVDFFHNYEHSPEGLTHCKGSEANPYQIQHVVLPSGKIEHKINLSYARGHGKGNEEQWFRFRIYLEDGFWLEYGEPIPEPPRDKWNVRESRFLSVRRARRVRASIMRQMARPKAGQKQRIGSGTYEDRTNRHQRKLVAVFDKWAAALKRDLATRAKRGATIPELQTFLDAQIPKLEERLAEIVTAGIRNAVKTAAGSRAENPAILGRAEQMIRENLELVKANLVPKVHEKLTLALATAVPVMAIGGLAAQQQKAVALAIKNASVASRSMPAQYAGGYWVAVFETQKTLGGVREDERAAQGLKPEPVKWNLDPRAEHCKASPGFFGCPDLAGVYPGGWRTLPTVPAGQVTCRGNAVLPGNIVDASLIELATRMSYSGPAVKLITQSGIETAITAYHPVLTPKGWLRAKFLREGDYVINSTFCQLPMIVVNDNHQNVPAFVEKIWDSLSMVSGIYTSPLSTVMADDFHGDGRFLNGDIEIVFPDGQLRREFDVGSFQPLNDSSFGGRLLAARPLTADGSFVQVNGRALATTDRVVVSGDLMQPLFWPHLRPFEYLGFALIPKVNSLSFERVGDSPAAYAQILRQLQDAFARLVTPDKLVDVVQFDYSGHAYDLQTDCGYYLANSSISQRQGIVLSNCRCNISVFRNGEWRRGVYDD